jgi:hypothetical protein
MLFAKNRNMFLERTCIAFLLMSCKEQYFAKKNMQPIHVYVLAAVRNWLC